MASDYSSITRNFDIHVDMSALASGIPVRDVQIEPEYPVQSDSTFEGLTYFPELPKLNYSIQFRFLEDPGQPMASDTDLGQMYNVEVDDHKIDGAYTQVQFQLQNIGDNEGIQALDVTSQLTYVGTRDTNC